MVSLQAFRSFLPRAPKFPLLLPLLTPATQAILAETVEIGDKYLGVTKAMQGRLKMYSFSGTVRSTNSIP